MEETQVPQIPHVLTKQPEEKKQSETVLKSETVKRIEKQHEQKSELNQIKAALIGLLEKQSQGISLAQLPRLLKQ